MSQSLSKIILHIVFSTKDRAKFIPFEFENEFQAYIAGICRTLKSFVYKIGGTEDHIHIACILPRTLTVSLLLEEIKTGSSKWIKTKSSKCLSFAWQVGYNVFSISQSQLPVLIRFIENQHAFHRRKTYEEELIRFLEMYSVDFDENYLWK